MNAKKRVIFRVSNTSFYATTNGKTTMNPGGLLEKHRQKGDQPRQCPLAHPPRAPPQEARDQGVQEDGEYPEEHRQDLQALQQHVEAGGGRARLSSQEKQAQSVQRGGSDESQRGEVEGEQGLDEKSLSAEHKTNFPRIMFYCVKRILPMRSMKRHKATGEMMVRVMWADEHESVTVKLL
jgi:hypothetical protein